MTSNNDDDSHETETPTTHQDRSNMFCAGLGMSDADVSEEMRECWLTKVNDYTQNLDAKFTESASNFDGEKCSRLRQKTVFPWMHQLTK